MQKLLFLVLLAPSLVLADAGYIVKQGNTVLQQKNADASFTPASITKVHTALLAINELGSDYQFKTPFYKMGERDMVIKASGDPWLDTNDLKVIAKGLKPQFLDGIDNIYIDASMLDRGVQLGGDGTNNPYAAIAVPFGINFNTISVSKSKGNLRSNDPDTPVIPYLNEITKSSGYGFVNTGKDPYVSMRYSGELLKHSLKEEGVVFTKEDSINVYWAGAEYKESPVYVYTNPRLLKDVIKGMTQYSNNYIANQLVLFLTNRQTDKPTTIESLKTYLAEQDSKLFGWEGRWFVDGSGLDRDNKITPEKMIEVLETFADYKDLLPTKHNALVKTGTMKGVSTLVGFKDDKIFAICINDTTQDRYALMNKLLK